jgi:hypothetical protein
MSNERPDEFAAWRRSLQQPEALPEQGLADKDATWDRLFDRLSEAPRRRFHGYRIVAACILISLIPAARLFQGRQATAGNHPASPQRVAPLASAPATPITRMPRSAAPVTRSKPATPLTVTLASRALPPAHALSPAHAGRLGPDQSRLPRIPILPPPAATLPLASIDPPPPTAYPLQQQPAVRKEWKVVDLNEIDPGRQRPHGTAANRQPTLIRIGLGIGNAGSAVGTAPPPEEDTRLKINLATQNR